MKKLLKNTTTLIPILLILLSFSSCSQDDILLINKTDTLPEVIAILEDHATLHSITLECAEDLVDETTLTRSSPSSISLYTATESAVLKGVQKYISQKEGRMLTSIEESTLRNEVRVYWNNSRNRTLIKNISKSSAISIIKPTTGSPDLNQLYRNYNISSAAQKYLNRLYGNVNSSNYLSILNQLYSEVWSTSTLSSIEKEGVLNAIAVTKDSYIYWSKHPMARVSTEVKGIIVADGIGALHGIWKGLGRSVGNLVFGPGGAVLTIGGSVVVSSAIASIEAGIGAGIIRIL